MRRLSILLSAAACLILASVPSVVMAAPFADGNFETPGHPGYVNIPTNGTVGPWKVTSGNIDYGTAPAQTSCAGGSGNCVDLNGTNVGAISQTFDTCTPRYRVDFSMSRHHMLQRQPATLVAHAGSQTFTFTHSPPTAPGTWVPETFTFASTGPTTTIAFTSTTTSANPIGAGPEIDNVSVKMVSCD
jgi:Protein of unknown function (DUF642)